MTRFPPPCHALPTKRARRVPARSRGRESATLLLALLLPMFGNACALRGTESRLLALEPGDARSVPAPDWPHGPAQFLEIEDGCEKRH